jgi:hypothetical protein
MSSPLAIAAVSAVLKNILDNALVDNSVSAGMNTPVAVRLVAPNRIKTDNGEKSQLNLYLYQVTPNSGWRNVDLPSRNGNGDRLTNPPLALNLHYLLTAYGAKDFDAEILLGYAMQMLHETPLLTRDAIRTTLGPVSPLSNILPPALGGLTADDLADQIELIKLTPEFLSTEEMSKLWTAMQTGYHTSVVYQASVVVIQSRRPTRPTTPVRDRHLLVQPFRQPTIDSVEPQIIIPGGKLTLFGANLKGDVTTLNFGPVSANPTSVTPNQIEVTVPANLSAGVNTVQVVHSVNFGTAHEPHRGFQSNSVAFMIAPQFAAPLPVNVARGSTLVISVTPPVGRAQNAALLLRDRTILIPARPASGPAFTSTLSFPIPSDFPTGPAPVRIQIDGAESSFDVDTNPLSATFHQYLQPLKPSLNIT